METEGQGVIPEEFQEAVRQESVSVPLDEAIAALMQAKGARNAKDALSRITSVLAGLDKEDLNLLMDQDEFQNLVHDLHRKAEKTAKPGTPIRDAAGRQIGKVPYSLKDVEEMFPTVEWTPTRTTHISYNGVMIFVKAYEKVKSPACFRDIFMDSEMETAKAYNQAAEVLRSAGAADSTSLAVGWYKPDDDELERRYGVERK